MSPQPVANTLDQENLSPQEQTKRLLAVENKVCSYGDTVHYAKDPKFFKHCQGSYLYDLEETPYLDLQMWYSAVNLGYGNPRVNESLKRQIDQLPQLACQYLHPEKIHLAEKLVNSVQKGFGQVGRVHFNVGGAQAVEDSLKLVRKHTRKQHMFAFEGGYHGRTLGASAITSSYRYREPFGEFGDRAEFIPFPYCFRCPYGKEPDSCKLYCAQQFVRKFETEYYGVLNPKNGKSEFGAFYMEPLQGTGGYVKPPEGYFEIIAEVCKAYGILLVDDEIQMGFFRTGKLWAMEHFGIKPDIIVFGKALTNGMNALSGLWAKEELINPEQFGPGSTHSTFSSNTLGTATGLEVMTIFEDGDFETSVPAKGAYFLEQLQSLQKKHPEIGDVDGLGLALRMEMCQKDGFTPSRELADAMFQKGLSGDLQARGKKMGLILDIGGYYKNVVTLAPSLTITHDEIDLGIELLDQVITQCKKEGAGA